MEHPTEDGPDLDDCRALSIFSKSSPRSICFTNCRRHRNPAPTSGAQFRSATSSSRISLRKDLGLFVALLFGLLLLSFSSTTVEASVLPGSLHRPVSQQSTGSNPVITDHDRFIAINAEGDASHRIPSDFEEKPTSLDPETLLRWIRTESSSANLEANAFLDRLYGQLGQLRGDSLTHVAVPVTPAAVAQQDSSRQLRFWKRATSESGSSGLSEAQKIIYGILIPVLVVLSGLFAGLTLGYMSLDETQLQVLSLQGTPQQKKYADKIMPIRKDGHLLLTTLLIANMITNETLPIIADPLLGGGVQAVIVSIVLVVIFAELIPQSVCSRYGLAIGAKLAPLTRVVILLLWPIAYPVSRVLHWTLGPHHGIVYRRAELKELVNMHAATAGRGDLNNDTVTIVGGALDLQEKVVKQAMTPIDKVFMISIDSKLGYETLQQIVSSGHSRIPVYQEIEIPVNKARTGSGSVTPTGRGGILGALSRKASASHTNTQSKNSIDDQKTLDGGQNVNEKDFAIKQESLMTTIKRKKIIGALLVKQCVLLDPEDETPVRDMVINALPTVPADEPLLNLLNVFQEGRSHLAIVSSRTRRFSPGSFVDLGSDKDPRKTHGVARQGTAARVGDLGNIDEEKQLSSHEIKKSGFWSRHLRRHHHEHKTDTSDLPPEAQEGDVDAGAVATEMAQRDVPIGIITLEDVLEELIGEEILDEYDSEVEQNFAQISPPPSPGHKQMVVKKVETPSKDEEMQLPLPSVKLPTSPKIQLPRFKLGRSGSQRDAETSAYFNIERVNQPVGPTLPTPAIEEEKVFTVEQPPPAGEATESSAQVRDADAASRPASSALGTSTSEDAPLPAPRANKPVVIRHQGPDGNIATAIVGEGLLRGRSTAFAPERSGENSRSNTPSGTRGNRFKSTPLPGNVPASPVTASAPRGKSMSKVDPASPVHEEPAQVASPEPIEDDQNKQLGDDNDAP